jgi:3-oxoacyl-[acyl-carrier protein] reductase
MITRKKVLKMSLEDKVAIVTGASRGIGMQIAKQLAAIGAKVVVNFAANRAKADEVVDEIRNLGSEAVALQADISKISEIEELFAATISTFGKVDILVNNAGLMENAPLAEVTEEGFDKHFAINVKGTYFSCQQAIKHMEPNGRIVNISTSVTGQMFPTYSVYAATKGAVEQITRQLAKEFGLKGITINCIAPGPVGTELFLTGKSQDLIDSISKMNAFQRLGEPGDIAPVVEFLVSEQSRWITGQTIRVNGGYI